MIDDLANRLTQLQKQQKKAIEVIENSQKTLDTSFAAAFASDKVSKEDKEHLIQLKKQTKNLLKNAKAGKDVSKQIEALKKQWAYKA